MVDEQGNNGKNEQTPLPGEIDYGTVFENHAALMKAYRAVLKNSLNARDPFCRSKFVESHIYKRLRSLRKIYSVEIATLPDSVTHRQTFEKLVKNIDEFLSVLFYFPTITLKGLASLSPAIVAAVGIVIGIIIHLHNIEPPGLEIVNNKFILYLISIILGTLLVILSFVSFSFMKKRFLFFFFPEDKLQGRFDRVKKMWKAFVGKEIEKTCYDKENKLFQSLVVRKDPEELVDIAILGFIMLSCFYIIPYVLLVDYILSLDLLPFSLFLCLCFIPIPFMFYFQVKRKAK